MGVMMTTARRHAARTLAERYPWTTLLLPVIVPAVSLTVILTGIGAVGWMVWHHLSTASGPAVHTHVSGWWVLTVPAVVAVAAAVRWVARRWDSYAWERVTRRVPVLRRY